MKAAGRRSSTESTRKRYLERMNVLKNEQATWVSHWDDLASHVQPRAASIRSKDRNRGTKANDKIINNTATRALGVLGAGMMAGITSPARPWFRLTTPDSALAEVESVKQWLHAVEERIRQALAKSNLYNVLPTLYRALGLYGTAVCIINEDEEDTLRGYEVPIGRYYLANSARNQVDTLYREVPMTTGQLVEMFGYDACSVPVRQEYDEGKFDQTHEAIHVIEPNRAREPERKDYRGKQWKSCWFETTGPDSLGFLRESGYDQRPFIAVRWDLTEGDVYGRSPGMVALGDIKALQLFEKRKAQLIGKIANPPMKGPSSLRNQRTSLLEGDITYVDSTQAGSTYEPAIVINPAAIPAVAAELREHEERINAAFYADLWLMMAQSDRRQITATEVEERHEEKMLQLGPVLERLMDELLDVLIDIVFSILWEAGRIPPPPEELASLTELKVEYISMMAQAQKMLGIVGVDRLAAFVGNLAAVKPDVVDKLNTDQLVDEYANMLGTKPDLVNSDEQVAAIREARNQAAQQQAQVEQMSVAAQGAKTLSETDTGSDNALTQLMGAMGGMAGSQGAA